MTRDAVTLAWQLLLAERAADPMTADAAAAALAALSADAVAAALPDDPARIATWLNLYNAATQRLLAAAPDGFAQRRHFFRRPAVSVAGTSLSLDDIEHGLLRRSRWKLGLGWARNPRPGAFERRFRVERLDPRIHFALNCAAASCPPIAAYAPARLDAQLDLATRGYLAGSVQDDGRTLTVPRVFLWFPGDFGGPAGIRRLLVRYGVAVEGRRLRPAGWDWTPTPGAWRPDDPSATAWPPTDGSADAPLGDDVAAHASPVPVPATGTTFDRPAGRSGPEPKHRPRAHP